MNNTKWKGRALSCEFSLPKASYEVKVQHVLDNTNQTREDVIKPKSVKIEDKAKADEPVVEEKPKPKREPKVKELDSDVNASTLFVRNVAWDVSQQQFKEQMETFGPVLYAVLCKAAGDMKVENMEEAATHKGTGFVRFKEVKDANSLLELSKSLEKKLD